MVRTPEEWVRGEGDVAAGLEDVEGMDAHGWYGSGL